MRYYVHSSLSLNTSARGILLDESQKLVDEGNQVFFSYCNGLLDMCFLNPDGDTAKCSICKRNYRFESKLVSKKISFIPLNNLKHDISSEIEQALEVIEYNSTDDIKNIKYEGINIGLACLSTYISSTRNLNPLIDEDFRIYFNGLLFNCLKFYFSIKYNIQKLKPDYVLVYNGRFMDDRPLFEYATKHDIPVIVKEAIKLNDVMYKLSFNNATSHSIVNTKNIVEDTWVKSDLSVEQRTILGNSFYTKKRNSEYTYDTVYTVSQKENYLPENWNENKHNIVIFNSSEDEFAAIGGDYDKYSLLGNQIQSLEKIFNHFENDKDLAFYLRIHPNLKKIKYKYHTDLEKFAKRFENVTVLRADSTYSSYALLDKADTVLTFGSTMGIEAVYWKKPTILLSGSLYYLFGCCYTPSSEEVLWKLLKDKLEPKDNLPAIQYGYYLMNEDRPTVYKLDFNYSFIKVPFTTIKFAVYNHLKLFNSPILFSISRFMCDSFHKLFSKKKYTIPTKETIEI